MFSASKMVDRGTGASPPWSQTREIGSSPIKFNSPAETSRSINSNHRSTKVIQETNNAQDVIVMHE